MEGHGEKYTRKQEQAIIALLSAPTIAEAAKLAGIGETTLWRWLQEPNFQEAYKEARRQAVTVAIGKLQQACSSAAQVLQDVAENENSPASARVSAAKSILDSALKATEQEDIIARLEKLEELAGGK